MPLSWPRVAIYHPADLSFGTVQCHGPRRVRLPASLGVAAAGTRQAGSFPLPKATPMQWKQEGLEQSQGAGAVPRCWSRAQGRTQLIWCQPNTPRFPQTPGLPPGDSGPPVT